MRKLTIFLAILLLFLVSGCKKDEQENNGEEVLISFSSDAGETYTTKDETMKEFDVLVDDYGMEGVVFFYATSYSELQEKINENKNPTFPTYDYPDDDEFAALLRKYNEEFFENNVLIFYYKYERQLSENYLYKVTKKDGILTLNVNRSEGEEQTISSYLILTTIKKTDFKGVKDVKVKIQTIAPLQTNFIVGIKQAAMRDFYMIGVTMDDFKDIPNLKEIECYYHGLTVDLVFKEAINQVELDNLMTKLEKVDSIESIVYYGVTGIRLSMKHQYYDEVTNKTLALTSLLEQSDINQYQISIRFSDFTLLASITFYLKNPGKANANQMKQSLKELNHPYIDYETLN